ncbi:Selenocysteine lyase/Cysteine desulfurase [Mycolicibacterium neoaurum]|nr:Selenocysteine lyase/Cysteine desulfurase [Mycolicibacterium neoaurum]
MTPEEFRAQFPSLTDWIWLDTPGAPPGARRVVDSLTSSLDDWLSGSFEWTEWDSAADHARGEFARYTGIAPSHVASQGSLAEAAATAVRCTPPGKSILVSGDEFRSVLFPALAYAASTGTSVRVVKRKPGHSRSTELLDAIDKTTGLVLVSEVLTNDGELVDLDAICATAHRHGALVFANLTQTLGVLVSDLSGHPADIIATHGYKWMLCPRGTTWLVADPDLKLMRAHTPSWKTASSPPHYFGGPYSESATMSRCNASPAWLSWIGARAALDLLGRLDEKRCREHVLDLANAYSEILVEAGFRILNLGRPSHVVVASPPPGHRVDAATLRRNRIRATTTEGGALRVGFHYFNVFSDVDAATAAACAGIIPCG